MGCSLAYIRHKLLQVGNHGAILSQPTAQTHMHRHTCPVPANHAHAKRGTMEIRWQNCVCVQPHMHEQGGEGRAALHPMHAN